MSGPPNPFDKAAEEAAKKTDEELGGEEPKLPTWEQLSGMLPDAKDKQRLDELRQIVKAATDHNKKVATLISNIDQLGGVVVKVLSKFL